LEDWAKRHGYGLQVVRMEKGTSGACCYRCRNILIAREMVEELLAGETTAIDIVYIMAHEVSHIYTSEESPYCKGAVRARAGSNRWYRGLRCVKSKRELVAEMAAVRICRGLGVPTGQVTSYNPMLSIYEHQDDIERRSGVDTAPDRGATRRYALAVADEVLFQSAQPDAVGELRAW